jgi:hypothetical protein
MSKVEQRRALAVLSRKRLLELIAAFELDVDPSEPEHLLVDSLARSRKASFDRILARLEPSELRKMLELSGITPSTTDALELRSINLGEDVESAEDDDARGRARGRGGKGGAFEEAFRKHMLKDLGFRKVLGVGGGQVRALTQCLTDQCHRGPRGRRAAIVRLLSGEVAHGRQAATPDINNVAACALRALRGARLALREPCRQHLNVDDMCFQVGFRAWIAWVT